MNNSINISIIIPTYKPQDYIWECLHSIKQQTLPKSKFEVLIILNGCKEPYYSQITSFLQTGFQDMTVRMIHTDTKGVSNARNVGIESARGKYLTFIDDDDFISPCYLQEMFLIAERGIVPVSNILAFWETKDKLIPYYAASNFKNNYTKVETNIFQVRSLFSMSVCKLISSDIIGNRRFNHEFKNGEDSLFMFCLSDKISKIATTSKNAIYYRRIRSNSASLSRMPIGYWLFNQLKLSKEYVKVWIKNPFKYNFFFFISRLVAVILNCIRFFFINQLQQTRDLSVSGEIGQLHK